MPALDMSSFDFALKELYSDQRVNEIVYKKNPLFAMLAKDENFLGDVYPQPVIFANPQGRSASLGAAITNNQSTKGVKFNLSRVSDYGVVKIDHQTLKASAGNPGAFIEARKTEIDGMLTQLGRSLAISLYRSGSGTIGNVTGSTAGTTITLADVSTISNFEVGQEIGASSTDGVGAARVGTATITAIDRDAGTLTSDSAWSGQIAGFVTGDFMFVSGDYGAKLSGLAGYLPAPDAGGVRTVSATPFFGVDRTADATRLAGVYFDGTGLPIEEALIELLSRVDRIGGSPDYIFLSPFQWVALEKSLGSKVTYMNIGTNATANVGFRGITVNGPTSPVTVLSDINCPNRKAYALSMETLKLRSLGKAPTLYDTDGLTMLRGTTTDDVEIRAYYYAQLSCNAPGYNGVAVLSAA